MEEKKRTTPLRRHFPLAFLFPLQKNVCIYTHIKRGDTCVHTWRMEKEGKKGRKGRCSSRTPRGSKTLRKRKRTKTLSSFCTAFCFSLLCFSLLFFVFLLDLKKGKKGGEKRRTATTTAALQDIRERWRKGNLKRGWR